MINPGKPFNIYDYVEIILRRIWYLLIPFVVILGSSALYAYLEPKEYRATTLILVTPQKVPEEFVRPTVTSKIEDRLQSIGQEIMSRTRLEQVISEFKLYSDEAPSLGKEEVVELMRRNVQVEIKGEKGYFSISYVGKDPRIVALVTNKLASLFIEENLKIREQQAVGTSEFLSTELNATKMRLEVQERATTQFKKQYMGELPEQREANLRVMDQLQMQYQRIGDSQRAAQDRKLLLQKQLSDLDLIFGTVPIQENLREERRIPDLSPMVPSPQAPTMVRLQDSYEQQLSQLKNQLVELQAKYKEQHPDVLMTKKKIADLEAKIDTMKENKELETPVVTKGVEPQVKGPVSPQPVQRTNPRLNSRYQEIETQILSTNMEIERLKQEDSKIRDLIARYRQRIENTPIREHEMTTLTRDYQNTKEAYQTLLKKSEGAQQAENLERRQKGEQFKVLDPARLPEKPFRPDIPKILMLGLLLGAGCGLGAAFFREQMDRSFRDAEDLETALGFKVLANLPRIEKKAM